MEHKLLKRYVFKTGTLSLSKRLYGVTNLVDYSVQSPSGKIRIYKHLKNAERTFFAYIGKAQHHSQEAFLKTVNY